MTAVDVWVAPAACTLDETCCSVAEQRHAASFGAPRAAARHRRGRALLRHALAPRVGVPPADVALRPPPCGAPEVLGPGRAFGTSVAHSGAMTVAAVRADGPVGIDVEVAARRRPVPDLVLTGGRLAAVAHLVDGSRAPVAVWVVLEAALKAAGTGFVQPHRAATFTAVAGGVEVDLKVGGRHGCRLRVLPDGVLVAVATPDGVPDVRWHVLAPPGQLADAAGANCSSSAAAYASAGSAASGAPSSPVTVVTQR